MALTQMQQIQSLGEALAWLERELNWGVKPASLSHLCGRIGELYACVLTNGQMALATHQEGYDVVAGSGERISVKTTTRRLPCPIQFSAKTLDQVDRVIVLRINTDEMQVESIYDQSIATARNSMKGRGSKLNLQVHPRPSPDEAPAALAEVRAASHEGYRIIERENGSIQVWSYGRLVEPAKPALRKLAANLGISTKNLRGNEYNTRQLGSRVLDCIQERWGHLPIMPPPSQDPTVRSLSPPCNAKKAM